MAEDLAVVLGLVEALMVVEIHLVLDFEIVVEIVEDFEIAAGIAVVVDVEIDE